MPKQEITQSEWQELNERCSDMAFNEYNRDPYSEEKPWKWYDDVLIRYEKGERTAELYKEMKECVG